MKKKKFGILFLVNVTNLFVVVVVVSYSQHFIFPTFPPKIDIDDKRKKKDHENSRVNLSFTARIE